MPNPIIHFEIMGADSKKTQQYYADLFGWNVDSNNPMNYGMASTKDAKVKVICFTCNECPIATAYEDHSILIIS